MEITDPTGHKIKIDKPPRRIVSLVPSLTETLFRLGLDDSIIGITRYCELPEDKVKSKTRVGGTKNPKLEVIATLEPDLIITDKEEILPEFKDLLMKKHPVFTTNIRSIEDALGAIADLAAMSSVKEEGDELVSLIKKELELTKRWRWGRGSLTTLYLIWWAPHMTVGKDCYIGDLLRAHGLKLAFPERGKTDNYFQVTIEDIEKEAPKLILLPDEPYIFNEEHRDIIRNEWNLPYKSGKGKGKGGTIIELVDGKSFCWYGARMVEALPYTRKVLGKFLKKKKR